MDINLSQIPTRTITTRTKPLIILINVEIIQQSIVNKFDQQKHLLVEQKGEGIFMVIKNKFKLGKMFQVLQKLLKQSQDKSNIYQTSQLVIVSYSSKPVNTLYDRLVKVNKYIADNMYYFNLQPKQHSTVRPNRAFINMNNENSLNLITYGQGYSQIKPKQQLRLATQCVFNLHQQMDRFFIIQTQKGLKQQQKQLKKQGYNNLFSVDDIDKIEKAINNIKEKQKSLQLEEKNNNIMSQQSLQNSYYLKSLRYKLKQQEFKQITTNIILYHFDQQNSIINPDKIIAQFLSKPKKSYTPTPKSTIRSPQSKQICSLVFKNVSDHKLYIAKSSTPKDIGGLYYQEKIENRCFISLITNLFCQYGQYRYGQHNKSKKSFFSLPLDKSYSMMKYSLLKPYQTKKACVLVKPYLQNLTCLDKHVSQFLHILKTQTSPIKGFGQMIFWSLISGQSFRTKTLLQQLSLIGFLPKSQNQSHKQTKYLTSNYQSLEQFIVQNKLKQVGLLRVDYYEPFSLTSSEFDNFFSMKEDFIQIPFTRQFCLNLDQLSTKTLQEIYQLAVIIGGDYHSNGQIRHEQQIVSPSIGYEKIKGIAKHYKWQFDKSEIIDSLFNRTKRLQAYVKTLLTQRNKIIPSTLYKQLSHNLITHLQHTNPLSLLLFLSQDYARFIKPPSPQQNYFSQFYQKMDEQKQNKYVTALIQKTHSFQIYGNCPPIYSLPNWIRSLGLKYRFIEYISMLTHTKEDFILISKRLKIMSTNQKNNALLIVDHCQLCQQILDEAKSVRTIFVSRFKKGQHQMQVICEEQNQTRQQYSKYLQESNDELVTLLLEIYQKYIMREQQKTYLFKRYTFVLQNYMKIKCHQYNFSYQKARQFCFQLHKMISQSKNRYKQIQQKYKANQQWRLLYTLPVQKKNQKITFIKNLQSFIQVIKFVQSICGCDKGEQKRSSINKGENGMMIQTVNNNNKRTTHNKNSILRINPKLLPSLKQWQKFIQPDIKDEIISELIQYINPLQKLPIESYLNNTHGNMDEFNVILQVLQVILVPYKDIQQKKLSTIHSNNNQKLYNKWHNLYYSLFPQQLALYHFPQQSIHNITKLSSHSYMMQLDEKLVIYNFDLLQQKCQKIYQCQGNFQLISCVEQQQQYNNSSKMLILIIRQISTQKIVRLLYDISNKLIGQAIIENSNNNNSKQAIFQMQISARLLLKSSLSQRKQQIQITIYCNNLLGNNNDSNNSNFSKHALNSQSSSTTTSVFKLYVQQNIDLNNQDILDVQIVRSQDLATQTNTYLLLIITTHNILVYRINIDVDQNHNQLEIKIIDTNSNSNNSNNNNNQQKLVYSYSLNQILSSFWNKNNQDISPSSSFYSSLDHPINYQFMSLLKYNHSHYKNLKEKANYQKTHNNQSLPQEKQQINTFIKKAFTVTTAINEKNQLIIKNVQSTNFNFNSSESLQSIKNQNSPLLHLTQQKLFMFVSNYYGNGKNNNKNQQSPLILIIDLHKPYNNNNPQLIPLFKQTQHQQHNPLKQQQQIHHHQNNQIKSQKIIHSINFIKQKSSLQQQSTIISVVIYYSLVDVNIKNQNNQQSSINYHNVSSSSNKIVNTTCVLITCSQNTNKVIVNYTQPQVHVFHSLLSPTQNHFIPIMSLSQQSNKLSSSPLSYILTVQGLTDKKQIQNQIDKKDSCLRIWKLNTIGI